METSVKTDLIDNLVSQERECHLAFFGKEFDLTDFTNTLRKYGEEKIKFWQELGLEPHFLPKVPMMLENNYPGWKVKPEGWFYKKLSWGKIFRQINGKLTKIKTVELEGISVLIDTRLKPNFDKGNQMYEKDNLCGPVIEELRESKKIANYDPQSSRFYVSADEWENQIKPVLAEKLGFETFQLRLEKTIEANVIFQLYYMPRKDDGKTSTWVWYEEYFKDHSFRLSSIFFVYSSLVDVNYRWSGHHWYSRSFRPLIVL